MIEEKEVLFSYYYRNFLGGEGKRTTVFIDGELKVEHIFPFSLDIPPFTTNDKEMAEKLSFFINEHWDKIKTLPKHLNNDQVLDGCEEVIQFRDKITEGINFTVPVTKESKKYRNITKMISIINEMKEYMGYMELDEDNFEPLM